MGILRTGWPVVTRVSLTNMRLVGALSLVVATGCHLVAGFDDFHGQTSMSSGGAGGVASGGSAGVGGQGAAGGGGGAGGAGGPQAPLADEGVVVRYFLDEQRGAVVVQDAIPPAVDLAVQNEGTSPSFGGPAGQRGASWESVDSAARIATPIAGTKLATMLQGSSTATIEAVLSISAIGTGTRLVHFGVNTEGGRFSLRSENLTQVQAWIGNDPQTDWTVDLASGRHVLHLVFDSNLEEGQRLRLFDDGELVPPKNLVDVDPMESLDLTAGGSAFHIGNRGPGGRSPEGTVHYVALYAVALTPAQIAANTQILQANDDP
jgi:Concanavalin A-like lectin/glucanases superfamily